MESLSELLKSMPKSSAFKQAEQKVDQLLTDPLIVKFRAKHPEVDDSVLRTNMSRLYQYVKEYNNCTNCPGLDLCPNDFVGHYSKLSVESNQEKVWITDHKVSCKKFIAKQSEEAIRNRVRSFYVDDRALTNGYSADEILFLDHDRASAARKVLKYVIDTKEQGLQHNGMYLAGSFGTGKTFLMCYMLYELAKSGYSGVIVYMPDFAEDLKAMFQEPQRLKETIELLKETDLLVFDDIGAENLNPWLRDHVIGTILNYRMNRKPTFFTSNYDLETLEKHFSFTSKDGDELAKGQRLMDRIRPFIEVIEVMGQNHRGRS